MHSLHVLCQSGNDEYPRIGCRRRLRRKKTHSAEPSGIRKQSGQELPAIVRERLIRFGHAVSILFLLDRVAFALAGGDHFGGELL